MNIRIAVLAFLAFASTASALCGYQVPGGFIPLSKVEPATLKVAIKMTGTLLDATLGLNLCSPTYTAPSGMLNCDPGFGVVFDQGSMQCLMYYNETQTAWASTGIGSSGRAYFSSLNGGVLNLTVECGATPALTVVGGSAVLSPSPDGKRYLTLTVSTSLACAPVTAPPTPPTPPSPSASGMTHLQCKDTNCQQCTSTVYQVGKCTVSPLANTAVMLKSCSVADGAIVQTFNGANCEGTPTTVTQPVGQCSSSPFGTSSSANVCI